MLQGSRPLNIPIWVASRIDDEAVEHYRSVGCFIPDEDRVPLTVGLVQRDDLGPGGDPTRIQRNPAQVRMSGLRLSTDEARQLVRLLNSAIGLIDGTGWQELRMPPQRRSA